MHEPVLEFMRIVVEHLDCPEPVYEFGSLQDPADLGYADIRSLFPGKKYVGTDMRDGLGVDVVLDLHHIDLPEEAIGTAIILNTLEHVERPWVAVDEILRVQVTGGMLILSVPFKSKIHAYPDDYWRFTPSCMKLLLKGFPRTFVSFAGEESYPHTVVGIGYGESTVLPEDFHREIEDWQVRWRHTSHAPRPFIEKFRKKWAKSIRKRLRIFRS